MPSFTKDKIQMDGFTFDDVLLIPVYSEVLSKAVGLNAKFSRRINAGMLESHPHDITMTNYSLNYSRK